LRSINIKTPKPMKNLKILKFEYNKLITTHLIGVKEDGTKVVIDSGTSPEGIVKFEKPTKEDAVKSLLFELFGNPIYNTKHNVLTKDWKLLVELFEIVKDNTPYSIHSKNIPKGYKIESVRQNKQTSTETTNTIQSDFEPSEAIS